MSKTFSYLFLLALALACQSPQERGGMFRGNEFHEGYYLSPAILKKPSVLWKIKAEGSIHSSASCYKGNIYFGDTEGYIYSADTRSGAIKWRFKTNGAVNSTPAVDEDLVYFLSFDGYFYAVNRNSGELAWKFLTAGEKYFSAPGLHGRQPKDSVFVDDWDFYLSSPSIHDAKVFFGTGSGYIYSLDKKTGKEVWSFKTNGLVHASPAVAYGQVYIGSWDSYFYALDEKTGKEKWKAKTGIDTVYYNQTGFQGSPLVGDGVVYAGCRDSRMYAFNAFTGEKKWERFNHFGWVNVSPVLNEKRLVYLTCDTRTLMEGDALSGDSIRGTPTLSMVFSSPARTGSVIYFGELNGFLTAYDLYTGKRLWTYQVESSQNDKFKILNPDSTLNFRLVFSKDKQKKESRTGLQMIFETGAILSSPVLYDGVIFFGSADGNFFALK